MTIEEQNEILIETLKEITNPIKAMRDRLKEGEQLDGPMASLLAQDPSYLKSLAHATLRKLEVS